MSDADPPIVRRAIRTLPFAATAIPEIAAFFGEPLTEAAFSLDGKPISRIAIPSEFAQSRTMLTFWPSLRRVDALAPGIAVVFTDIASVDFVEGVEVIFRRANGDILIVPHGGKVIVRA